MWEKDGISGGGKEREAWEGKEEERVGGRWRYTPWVMEGGTPFKYRLLLLTTFFLFFYFWTFDTKMVQIIYLWLITGIDYKLHTDPTACLNTFLWCWSLAEFLDLYVDSHQPCQVGLLGIWQTVRQSWKIQLEPENKSNLHCQIKELKSREIHSFAES